MTNTVTTSVTSSHGQGPRLAIGGRRCWPSDGALGFWKALLEGLSRDPRAEVLVAQDRQCARRAAAVSAAGSQAALAEIYNAEDRKHAVKAATTFPDLDAAKWPRAGAKVTDDLDVLLAFYAATRRTSCRAWSRRVDTTIRTSGDPERSGRCSCWAWARASRTC